MDFKSVQPTWYRAFFREVLGGVAQKRNASMKYLSKSLVLHPYFRGHYYCTVLKLVSDHCYHNSKDYTDMWVLMLNRCLAAVNPMSAS